MSANRKWTIACVATLCLLAVNLAYAVGDSGSVKESGLIISRNGDRLTLKTPDAGNMVVLLSDNTKVEEPKGAFHVRHKQIGMTALVPGLKIQVQGTKNPQGQLAADKVSFSKKDLQTAQEIQAGLAPTKQEVQANQQAIQTNKQDVAANQQKIESDQQEIASNKQEITTDQREVNKRFSELSDYDVKSTADAYFAPGSSTLSEKDQAALHQVANQAVNLTGYVIQVKGFADSSGNPVQNQKLSMERADAVIAYLEQTGNVPLRHIVAPGAMGTSDPAASNETSQGRADNRRVEVKVLVNRGLTEK